MPVGYYALRELHECIRMKWILTEEEHHRGSADPFVARTVMQAGRIVQLYELGEDREQGVIHVFNQLRRHLHQCDDIGRRLVSEINSKSELKSA